MPDFSESPPRSYLSNLSHYDRIRNGVEPDWRTARDISKRINWVLANSRKMVFNKFTNLHSLATGVVGNNDHWRFYCHTGQSVKFADTVKLRAYVMVAPADASANDPKWRLTVNDGGGDVSSDWASLSDDSSTPSLSTVAYQSVDIDVDPNTAYQCRFEVTDRLRLLSAAVYEDTPQFVETKATYAANSLLFSDGVDVTDAQHTILSHTNVHSIWKTMGSHLLNVVPDDPISTPFTRTTASWANIIDNGGTTVDANSPGFRIQTRYHNALHTANVPCVLAVHGQNAASAGGQVRLEGASGTIASLSSFSTAGEWKTAAFNLDGSVDTQKIDVHFIGDGTNVFTCNAVSVYELVS